MWWVLALQPTHKDRCDAIVAHIVTPLMAQGQRWGAERVSFARDLDPNKPQVEVHLLTSTEVVDRLRTFTLALTGHRGDLIGEVGTSESHSSAYPPRHDEQPSPRIEGALAKYGGIEGIALTMDVAEVSSDLAAWAIGRFPNAGARSAQPSAQFHRFLRTARRTCTDLAHRTVGAADRAGPPDDGCGGVGAFR